MTSPEERLVELNICLPPAQPALAQHLPVIISRGLAFVSGHGPMDSARVPVMTGPVGSVHTEEEGAAGARLSVMNALASLRSVLGTLDRVERVVKVTGFVLSAPGFERQPWVVDGASQLLVDVFGEERGAHARTSIGVPTSSLSLTVTIEVIFEVAA